MTKHVMVVDDEPSILMLVSELLETEGYRVTACADLDAARLTVAQDTPDVILLDYILRGVPTGPVWRVELRGNPRTSRIPVVVCTAAGPIIAAHRSELEAQHVRVLEKPFSLDALLTVVAQALAPVGT